MYIRCWGSRGSLPVSGEQFDKYGGDTTCLEIRSSKGDIIVIDAGSGIRALGNKLIKEKVSHINMIFTHAHWDHILGFPFFSPVYQKSVDIDLYGCPFSFSSYKEILTGLMRDPYFPVGLEAVRATLHFNNINSRPFKIGAIKITPITLSHPNGGLGFKFEEKNKSFVFLTDNELGYIHAGGLMFEEYADFCKGTDLLIHDAEYTAKDYKYYRIFGHSEYTDAVKLALCASVKRLGLFHLNRERTDDEVDEMVDSSQRLVAQGKGRTQVFSAGYRSEFRM